MASVLLRFRDLKDRRIVSNHVTLGRWIAKKAFHPASCLARTRGSGVKTKSMRGSCRAPASGVRNDRAN